MRIYDELLTLDDIIGITAMIQAMAVWVGDKYEEGIYLPLQQYWIVRENKWRAARWAPDADVIVDAVIGTGLRSAPRNTAQKAIEAIIGSRRPVVSVDIPSGVDATTGQLPGGLAVQAAVTVTLGLAKIGHLVYPGRRQCGILELVDIFRLVGTLILVVEETVLVIVCIGTTVAILKSIHILREQLTLVLRIGDTISIPIEHRRKCIAEVEKEAHFARSIAHKERCAASPANGHGQRR